MNDRHRALLLCLGLLLLGLTVVPVSGLDDSTVKVTVSGSKLHVEVNLRIQLPLDILSQFVDAEDAYSRDRGVFRNELRSGIESGVRELVPEASVTGLNIVRVDCDEDEKKMYVELSFDVENMIVEGDAREYDLKWRSFAATNKFTCEGRNIKPSEALGLDFHDFNDPLDGWTVGGSSGNTVIQRREEYELSTDDGDVDLRVTMSFTLPGTGMTVGSDKVTSKGTAESGGTQQPPQGIPGFPWEGVAVGVALALAVILRRSRLLPPRPILI
jgi:hypothetical protein